MPLPLVETRHLRTFLAVVESRNFTRVATAMRFHEAIAPATGASDGLAGHLDIGVIPALTLAWVPRLLARIAADSPDISVRARETEAPARHFLELARTQLRA